jgi:pilus assembly protein CpaB
MDRLDTTGWQELLSRLAVRRRLVAAALAGVAVLAGLHAVRPTPSATHTVWIAARDLTGGQTLRGADLATERLPVADVPTGALTPPVSPAGRLLAAPLRRGEPVTDVSLLGRSLLAATSTPGDVAVPVRVADGPAALTLVEAGDMVDVIAAGDAGDSAPESPTTVVHDVRVLATPSESAASDGNDASGSDGLLIVEASPHQAAALATAATHAELSVAVRRPP